MNIFKKISFSIFSGFLGALATLVGAGAFGVTPESHWDEPALFLTVGFVLGVVTYILVSMKKISILLMVIAVFIASIFTVTQKQKTNAGDETTQQVKLVSDQIIADKRIEGDGVIFGMFVSLPEDVNGVALIHLFERFTDQKEMEQAALEDGVCTQERIDTDTCFASPIYIRDLQTIAEVSIEADMTANVYAREKDGTFKVSDENDIFMESLNTDSFIKSFNRLEVLKYAFYKVVVEDGKIVSLTEEYVP